MGFSIPPNVNYPSPLVPVHSNMQDEPKIRQQIPAEIDWATTGFVVPGGGNCIAFNAQLNGYEPFEQFSTLEIDNSQCDADVVFYFPDTTQTLTVPANTPYAVLPVLSNSLIFYVSAPAALAGDITRFNILNYPVPPVVMEPTQERAVASTGGIVLALSSTTQLIPAAISGTLTDLFGSLSWSNSGGPATANLTIQDGTGRILVNNWFIDFPTGFAGASDILFTMPGIDWRFKNGLQAIYTLGGGAPSGGMNLLTPYKMP